ncbi:hypothetical protein Kpol_413p5 [Vanderwaltozyma polyspora DSM 70294]|uniref:Pre-mRNA-splicing factor CEF1 n=1 Tax=Vanderwaltozyma polyspora (strain ATCC 22028 / DSM 70294 / BCRC 21397 / CBS 2163 / NBRC 10782 / NRRL Y-8283 / UCD 57-17) TaxID=436907 RepID=A7TRH0_VANPO|nr:uncharacterized protein Kpol_413p5 [Vanderwaltozyma polyspora DSM 70294]EDO15130.1 hypothetical protein Kpol_413p5 [Vanderwaltozyma polyspora DSM 70294]
MAPVPIYIKGGVWSNVEDQIVKAAIQKYGSNKWDKVASLLQKKSARQCELRWKEFLDPSLNFASFSEVEDHKLLLLVRELPNQWRTIAERMGRPAQVCIDRYNKLLGVAGDDGGLNLKIGDVNPIAETQRARPDVAELDEDEREMVAEAKARLLNTQGKKATRKIRERMLEESKRIAQLQKRRELKQSGIETKIRKNKKRYADEIDYNEDIPYEQEPQLGIYDTTKEDQRVEYELKSFEKKVNYRGLKDKNEKNLDKIIRKRKNEGAQVKKGSIRANDSVLTNEYKKPKLELPKPGQIMENLNVKTEEQKKRILEAQKLGSLLSADVKGSNESVTSVIVEKPVQQNRLVKKDDIIVITKLFASLPKPKNDFDIILDEDFEESATEEVEEISIKTEAEVIPKYEPIALNIACLDNEKLPTPEFIENPKNALENNFNELVALSMNNTKYIDEDGLATYLSQVEELMGNEPKQSKELKIEYTDDKSNTIESLKMKINDKISHINSLKESLLYVNPLQEQNNSICRELCSKKIPSLRELQHNYFVYYKMYQNESKEMNKRNIQLKEYIESST